MGEFHTKSKSLLLTALITMGATTLGSCSSGQGGDGSTTSPEPAKSASTTQTAAAPTPTVAGSDASVVVQVDCGTDGVAGVNIVYGTHASDVLVGRSPTTLSVGGMETFSSTYGTGPGFGDALLTVTTEPTSGTCKTTLTNYNSGDVLGERETAGRVVLKAVVSEGT